MTKKHTTLALFSAAVLSAAVAQAQQIPDIKVDGRTIQVHAFVSQGYAKSDDNNFLTMDTSSGSGAFTDFGVNVSSQITDKFRVGAQMYDRNIGNLTNWQPSLDWAIADYKFKDWFGIRAGKVKTALGLFNDTQDTEALHTWAILPQSMYPLDLRASTIAHTGGDIYGRVGLKKAGSFSYTAYWGIRPDDPEGGYYINAATVGTPIKQNLGKVVGGDVRWETPVAGLTLGTSWMGIFLRADGTISKYGGAPFTAKADPEQVRSAYADYVLGKWHFSTEYRRNHEMLDTLVLGRISFSNSSDNEFFASAAYRINKHLELGTYNSRFYIDKPSSSESAADHIFDQTVTARIDLTNFWNVKVEGHFMDGYGSLYSAHGFYLEDNMKGLQSTTNMLVLRTGLNF